MRKPDYGTATADEIIEGIHIAHRIASEIQAMPNPAVQNLVKTLVALINVQAPSAASGKEGE